MSDLTTAPADHGPTPTPCNPAGNTRSRDRAPAPLDRARVVVAVVTLVVGCVRQAAPSRPLPSGPIEVWVDGSALEGGDGSRKAPLRSPPDAGATLALHLRSGLYRGPFRFPPGSTVEGHGEVVLFLDEPGAVVEVIDGPLTLTHLSVQGGTTGIEAQGPVRLTGVHFSGHREVGIRVGPDAGVEGRDLVFESSIDSSAGVFARQGTVALSRVTLRGPMKVGVEAHDSTVQLEDFTSQGVSTAVKANGGTLSANRLSAAAGRGPAITVGQTSARLRAIDVTGHEFALLGRGQVDVDGLVSRGAQLGGVSLVRSTVRLDHVQLQRAGNLGGVQLLECESVLGDVRVSDSEVWGVMVRLGHATIARLDARALRGERGPDGVLSLGDGLHVRDARVEVAELVVADSEGAGLFATSGATVQAGTLTASRTGFGAVVSERGSQVTATSVTSNGSMGPSVSAPDDGQLTIEDFTGRGGDVSVWADCQAGARVSIKGVRAGTLLPTLRCLKGPLSR